MTDPIKYIVVTVHHNEIDDYHYIAKQGSAGPIHLTGDEVDDVVRRLNGKYSQREVDEYESGVKLALAGWRQKISQDARDLLGPNDFDALVESFMFKPRENLE